MRRPHCATRREGLEGELRPRADRRSRADRSLDVGHDGAMPGFLAETTGGWRRPAHPTTCHRGSPQRCCCPPAPPTVHWGCSTNCWTPRPERDPAEIEPWQPGEPAPEELRGVLGRWWGEGFEYVFPGGTVSCEAGGANDPAGTAARGIRPVPSPAGRAAHGGRPGGRRAAAADPRRPTAPWSGCTGPPTGSPGNRRRSTVSGQAGPDSRIRGECPSLGVGWALRRMAVAAGNGAGQQSSGQNGRCIVGPGGYHGGLLLTRAGGGRALRADL